ncbi:MAG: O-antigen ligase family protein [Verrucomicrobia bacterium]|nr:O-antigen ligase family protein [Verrucomicrobiota bacterium]
MLNDIRADEAGAAGNEHIHVRNISTQIFCCVQRTLSPQCISVLWDRGSLRFNLASMDADENHRSPQRSDRIRTPAAYKICEGVSGSLICVAIVFTPWAFGTTQDWSVWTMNVLCCLLGAVLVAKWLIRRQTAYKPARWGEAREIGGIRLESPGQRIARYLTVSLAAMSAVLLAYCLASVWNARATYLPLENRFEYHDYIAWLPHTYNRTATLNAFWQYLGLAFFFWATRDWLLGKTSRERREAAEDRRGDSGERRRGQGERRTTSVERSWRTEGAEAENEAPESESRTVEGHAVAGPRGSTLPRFHASTLPARLRLLLWVLCINGAALALEGILQRLDGTNKLLWLVVPYFNNVAEAQFGPYAYRSNAATYLNLIWPVCLGFWLMLRNSSTRMRMVAQRIGGGSYMVLLPCAVVMASAPIISTSRGGALIALAAVPVASGIVFFAARRERALVRASMLTLFLVILGFSTFLGWKDLALRLENMFSDNIGGRMQIYDNCRAIAEQFPLLGTGPASFPAIYQLYKEPNQVWEAYLHDDWLETRITFGGLGFGLILLMLAVVLLRWSAPNGIPAPWEFPACIWLAMVGCLIHAKFDFPLQVYSIHFLFLLLCSIAFCLARK